MSESASNLKPCPFCGSEDIEIEKAEDGKYDYNGNLIHPCWIATCNNCEIETAYFGTKEEAVFFWNTRSSVSK